MLPSLLYILTLWGANIRPSGSELVLVEQAAEQVASANLGWRRPRSGKRDRRGLRSPEPEAAVWSVGVVVADVRAEHPFELSAVDDQDPVQALAAQAADPAFADRVGPRRAHPDRG